MLAPEAQWGDVANPKTIWEATQAVAEQLIREGHIELYAVGVEGSDDRPLGLDAALAAIGEARNWQPPGEEGTPVLSEVGITASGEAEYWKLRRDSES